MSSQNIGVSYVGFLRFKALTKGRNRMKTKMIPLYEVSEISQAAFLKVIGHPYTSANKGGDVIFIFRDIPYSDVQRFFENEAIPIQSYIKQVQAARRLIYQFKIGGRHEK